MVCGLQWGTGRRVLEQNASVCKTLSRRKLMGSLDVRKKRMAAIPVRSKLSSYVRCGTPFIWKIFFLVICGLKTVISQTQSVSPESSNLYVPFFNEGTFTYQWEWQMETIKLKMDEVCTIATAIIAKLRLSLWPSEFAARDANPLGHKLSLRANEHLQTVKWSHTGCCPMQRNKYFPRRNTTKWPTYAWSLLQTSGSGAKLVLVMKTSARLGPPIKYLTLLTEEQFFDYRRLTAVQNLTLTVNND